MEDYILQHQNFLDVGQAFQEMNEQVHLLQYE